MKLMLALLGQLAVVSFASAATTTKCNADNCARAVTGTLRAQTASHFADCQSFLDCTVTPAQSTATPPVVTVTPAAVTVTLATTVVPPVSVATVTGNFPEGTAAALGKRQAAGASAVTNCPSAVPTYASACSGSVRYSSACSCFGATGSTTTLPAQTTTLPAVTTTLPPVTVTVIAPTTASVPVSTVTVVPTPPALCNNAGLQYAVFNDNQPSDSAAAEANFDPTVIKTETPIVNGVTNYLAYNNNGQLYGQGIPAEFFVVEHRGYIFAPETGTYTFTSSNVDDSTTLWVGPAAYSGWTKGNANQFVPGTFPNGPFVNGSGTYTQQLVTGNYYPTRLIYKNGNGPGYFDYAITAPSGYTIVGSDPNSAQSTPFLVQYSCDGALAPQYQPYGQET